MGMAAIMFNGVELFEQTVNISIDRRLHLKSGENLSSSFIEDV